MERFEQRITNESNIEKLSKEKEVLERMLFEGYCSTREVFARLEVINTRILEIIEH